MVSGWRNPYVTSGIVIMFDGIWNIGGGAHSSTSTKWRDLIRNVDATYSDTGIPSWKSNCWTNVRFGPVFSTTMPDLASTNGSTVEIVAECINDIRGVIFGSYLVTNVYPNANQCNFEYYTGKAFRNYYNGYPDFKTSNNTFSLNTKCYFASTRLSNVYKIYDGNGNQLASSTNNNLRFTASTMYIGGDARPEMRFSGNIYAIRLYDRALSVDEIRYNYNIDKKRFNI